MMPKVDVPKGIIAYYHPTIFGKLDVPTLLENQIQALAGLYCSQGYIILFPNYVGYDSDQKFVHPYVEYPWQNVKSMILFSPLTSSRRRFEAITRKYPVSSFLL